MTFRLFFALVGIVTCAASQSTRSALDALEQQRELFRAFDHAIEGDRDLLAAGQCLARMSKLPTRVPLPFDATALTSEDLQRRARDLLLRFHGNRAASGRRKAVLDQGRMCTDCGGSGVLRCAKCGGQGRGAPGSAGFCPPWNPCETCGGLGRQGLPEGGAALVASAWSLVERLAAETDPAVAIKGTLADMPREVHLLALPRDGEVGKLWEALSPFPIDPLNLPSSRKARLRTVWRSATLIDRRSFLFDLAQHLLALERQMAYLGDDAEVSSAMARSNEFLRVSVSDLEFLACDYLQGAVEVEAAIADIQGSARGGMESPLTTFLHIEGLDPRLVCAFLYTPEDQELFRTLFQSGVGPDRETLLSGYPFAKLHKQLAALKPKSSVLLRGVIKRLPPGGPLYAFEIWELDGPDGTGGKR